MFFGNYSWYNVLSRFLGCIQYSLHKFACHLSALLRSFFPYEHGYRELVAVERSTV